MTIPDGCAVCLVAALAVSTTYLAISWTVDWYHARPQPATQVPLHYPSAWLLDIFSLQKMGALSVNEARELAGLRLSDAIQLCKPKPSVANCRNCGAPVVSKCSYCGTEQQ